jgi:hypothetical protein
MYSMNKIEIKINETCISNFDEMNVSSEIIAFFAKIGVKDIAVLSTYVDDTDPFFQHVLSKLLSMRNTRTNPWKEIIANYLRPAREFFTGTFHTPYSQPRFIELLMVKLIIDNHLREEEFYIPEYPEEPDTNRRREIAAAFQEHLPPDMCLPDNFPVEIRRQFFDHYFDQDFRSRYAMLLARPNTRDRRAMKGIFREDPQFARLGLV